MISIIHIFLAIPKGGDLDNMIKQVKEAGKVLDQSLVLDWFVQLTNAVRYIHDRYSKIYITFYNDNVFNITVCPMKILYTLSFCLGECYTEI